MSYDNKTPEDKREQLRQDEIKKNPAGEGNSPGSGNLADLVGGLSWKGTGLILVILVVGFIVFSMIM